MKRIIETLQIVERGLPAYTNAVVQATLDGYSVSNEQGQHPDFLPGIFMCHMVKYEEIEEVNVEHHTHQVEVKPKCAYNKQKDEMKAQLTEKLGDAAKSVRDIK